MRYMYILLGIAGFIFLLGTAGMMDIGEMEARTATLRSFIGIGIMGVSYFGIRCCQVREVQKRYDGIHKAIHK